MPGVAVADPGAGHVGGVEHQLQAALRAQRAHLGVAAGVPAHADEADRPRARRDPRRDLRGVEAEVLVHVGKDGPEVLVEDGVVGGDEGEGRRDHLVPVLPAAVFLQQPEGEMQPRGGRAQEVRVGKAAVVAPGLLEGHRLVPEAGPALLEAFADLRQDLVDAEGGHEQVDGIVHRARPGPARAGRTAARRRLRPPVSWNPVSRYSFSAWALPASTSQRRRRRPSVARVADEQGEARATPGRGRGAPGRPPAVPTPPRRGRRRCCRGRCCPPARRGPRSRTSGRCCRDRSSAARKSRWVS